MASGKDMILWAREQMARLERANKLPEQQFALQGERLAAIMARFSPRATGALSRSWRFLRTDTSHGVLLAAKYARKVDRGGTSTGRSPLGLLIPLRGRTRGSLAFKTGSLVTVRTHVRGLLALVLGRKSRQLVAVRKASVIARARPYFDEARMTWRHEMTTAVRRAMRIAVIGGK